MANLCLKTLCLAALLSVGGAVRAEDMARTGIVLNLIGVIPITLIVVWLL